MENNKITGNEPAMPIVMGKESDQWYVGLTIRQQFAMAAMQGMLTNMGLIDTVNWEWIAGQAVKQADALIAELNK